MRALGIGRHGAAAISARDNGTTATRDSVTPPSGSFPYGSRPEGGPAAGARGQAGSPTGAAACQSLPLEETQGMEKATGIGAHCLLAVSKRRVVKNGPVPAMAAPRDVGKRAFSQGPHQVASSGRRGTWCEWTAAAGSTFLVFHI